MSEWINNVSQRKQTLLNILRQLHEGKSVDQVKAEFGELARQASYSDIAEVEQLLMNEGVPAEEIQNLCDVHVAVFKESLDHTAAPETIPGHPVHTFRAENDLVNRFFSEIQAAFEQYQIYGHQQLLKELQGQLDMLKEFDCHYRRKEYLLFPYLEKYGFTGPSKVMWGLHDDIRAQIKKIAALLENASPAMAPMLSNALDTLVEAMRSMTYKEEKILLPTSLQLLQAEDWRAIYDQEEEIGHFLGARAGSWSGRTPARPDVEALPTPKGLVNAAGELPLDTGLLSLEQINLMLRHLPVDITYVDEHDKVRYFSQSLERIFERTPAIIGREVQNCHPPQSVDRVQRILDDFRSGKREVAEFWINMGPRFVHIRYFALRDTAGAYRGTIEVTQDLAPLRALEGERRLLDE
ncbi:MAG TPA: DUF438 domain-containing protein [Levilinea sp.]|nr:DUF438 domain-containing protein [Levilinea sp.]